MIVAQLRGAKFVKESEGYWIPDACSFGRAEDALQDIAKWLGFRDESYLVSATASYITALEKERGKIFLRAKD